MSGAARFSSGLDDTIVALATPLGRGALALVRVSGKDAFSIARHHVEPWPGEPRSARLCTVSSGGRELDQAVVTLFPAPHSFTGEDIVEISTHGGHVVPSSVIAALIESGARQALPGEFTRRAVLNGKLDVLQAEAIGDLIDARSQAMHRTALLQLDGGLSRRILALREEIIGLEALLAYDIDFPEEDEGPVARERIQDAASRIVAAIEQLLATAAAGELVREGALVVIAGPPNVGKSSLFNALLGRSRAIVTEIPGTTRDALEAVIDSGSWPLRLVDTAGLRSTTDRIEQLGIEVSERYLADAAVVLACAEREEDLAVTAAVVASRSRGVVIRVRTKIDLVTSSDDLPRDPDTIGVSAETGSGLRELLSAITDTLTRQLGSPSTDVPMLTRARHRHALSTALVEVQQFQRSWLEEKLPATIAAVHLRSAAGMLEELIGAVDVEDVLERVFSTFCVGK